MSQRVFNLILLVALAACAACRQTSQFGPIEVHSPTAAAIYPISLAMAEPTSRVVSTNFQTGAPRTENAVQPLPLVAWEQTDTNGVGTRSEFSLLDDPDRISTGGWGAEGTRWSVMGERATSEISGVWSTVAQDHQDYYSIGNLGLMAVGFGAAAGMANSDADTSLQHWVQDDTRSWGTNQTSEIVKPFGNGAYMLPAFAAAWLAGEMFDNVPLGEMTGDWGGRCMRSMLIGMPPLLVAQYATGGSRPGESAAADWKPFDDNNGASGHAFIGALPFINAARMTDNLAIKAGLYACSTLPAWSRVNDNAHYPSQSLLGWWLAYCAATAVDTGGGIGAWQIVPLPWIDGAGMGLSYQF